MIAGVRDELRRAMAQARASGWTICRGVTYKPSRKECCALGALLIGEAEAWGIDLAELGKDLGLEAFETWSIIHGFDGGRGSGPFYELGRELAREFVK